MPRCSGKESGKECFATDTCKPSPSAPSAYVGAKSEMMALRHKHDDASYAFRPPPPPPPPSYGSISSTTKEPDESSTSEGTRSKEVIIHKSNMPMVEYPGPTGPIRVQRGWTAPDMMEAGKQLPSLESGGHRFGEELVSFCKNWSPTSHELQRLLKKTSNQFQRIVTNLDGDYHQEQSEWRAAGAYESVQSSCIGWKEQRLREIRRRAKHGEERQTEERDKELEK
ncbi:hypothetical protein GBF38_000362, partial [Nibea albiflora]